MSSIDEEMNAGIPAAEPEQTQTFEAEVVERPSFKIPEFLKAETGAGDIESYVDHPMNFNKSMPLARMLRGFTGMFGSLRYAVIDIVLGAFEMRKPKP